MKRLSLLLFLLILGAACRSTSAPVRGNTLRSEHFSGFPIFDRHGDRVGVVHSTIISPESDGIRYALVQVKRQGFPYGKASMVTSPETLVPVPWELLSAELAEENLILSVEINSVEEAPGYDIRRDEFSGGWEKHVRDYWQAIEK